MEFYQLAKENLFSFLVTSDYFSFLSYFSPGCTWKPISSRVQEAFGQHSQADGVSFGAVLCKASSRTLISLSKFLPNQDIL